MRGTQRWCGFSAGAAEDDGEEDGTAAAEASGVSAVSGSTLASSSAVVAVGGGTGVSFAKGAALATSLAEGATTTDAVTFGFVATAVWRLPCIKIQTQAAANTSATTLRTGTRSEVF